MKSIFRTIHYIWTHPGNQRRRGRALGRAMAWQLYKRFTRRHWDVALARNRTLRCYPHNTSASSVIYAGLFDFDEMNFLLRYLRPHDNFLDVGANIGVYTLLASSVIVTGRVHAFEPSTPSRLRLAENIRLNRLNNVSLYSAAASDAAGGVRLSCGSDTTNHIVAGHPLEDSEPVAAIRLDEVVSTVRFAMGKMDIEGAELPALRGASRMLQSQNPPVWLLEVSNLCESYGYRRSDLSSFLRQHGYSLATFDAGTNKLRAAGDLPSSQNVLAIHGSYRKVVEFRLRDSASAHSWPDSAGGPAALAIRPE